MLSWLDVEGEADMVFRDYLEPILAIDDVNIVTCASASCMQTRRPRLMIMMR